MGLYINLEAVRVRLLGKVRFTENEGEENKMHVDLANRLISEAEGSVEFDLSPRYAQPFVSTTANKTFKEIPDRPTREYLRTLCELQATIRILETDFGRGSGANGDKYKDQLQKRYDGMVAKLMAKRKDGGSDGQGWMYPPMPGIALAYQSGLGDDGFQGQVIVANGFRGPDYATHQINSPGDYGLGYGYGSPWGGYYGSGY